MNASLYRAAYNALVKNYAAKKGPNGKARKPVIVQSNLRLESALGATQLFPFFTQKGQGAASPFNTENRLDINDGFTIVEMGLFICKPSSSTATNFKLYSYPNATVFSTSNTASSLDGLYNNGVLNISKSQVKYLQNWDLLKHRRVPIWQDGLTTGYTTSGATVPNGLDSIDGSNDTFVPVTPFISFTGRDNMDINITCPGALAAAETNSRLVLILRGFVAYNVAR